MEDRNTNEVTDLFLKSELAELELRISDRIDKKIESQLARTSKLVSTVIALATIAIAVLGYLGLPYYMKSSLDEWVKDEITEHIANEDVEEVMAKSAVNILNAIIAEDFPQNKEFEELIIGTMDSHMNSQIADFRDEMTQKIDEALSKQTTDKDRYVVIVASSTRENDLNWEFTTLLESLAKKSARTYVEKLKICQENPRYSRIKALVIDESYSRTEAEKVRSEIITFGFRRDSYIWPISKLNFIYSDDTCSDPLRMK